MAKIRICKEPECQNAATTEGYCRLHYLKNWKRLKEETLHRSTKRLNKYIENVMKKHPDRYMEVIKKDIRSSSFESFVDSFDDEESGENFKDDAVFDEEVEKLFKQLKIEKGF